MTPHAAVPAAALPSAVPELHARIGPVLGDLAFPAERWQAVTEGDLYGVDGVTRSLIGRLPERRYGSLAELIHVLAAVLTGRTVPPASQPMSGRAPLAGGVPATRTAVNTPPAQQVRTPPARGQQARTPQTRTQPARTPVPARAAAPARTAGTPTARIPAAPATRRPQPA